MWALVVAGWLIGGLALMSSDHTEGFGEGVTRSLVERMGLFTIIVLGEVVVGVVGGITDAEYRDPLTITTGMIGLTIGMGIWWNYFDTLGRRVPGQRGRRLAGWLYSHVPLTMAISASGAAMVSLLEHAGDSRTPTATCLAACRFGRDRSWECDLGVYGSACRRVPDRHGSLHRSMFGVSRRADHQRSDSFNPAADNGQRRFLTVLLLGVACVVRRVPRSGGDPEVTDFELGTDGGRRAADT